jgi:hypothetical protein
MQHWSTSGWWRKQVAARSCCRCRCRRRCYCCRQGRFHRSFSPNRLHLHAPSYKRQCQRELHRQEERRRPLHTESWNSRSPCDRVRISETLTAPETPAVSRDSRAPASGLSSAPSHSIDSDACAHHHAPVSCRGADTPNKEARVARGRRWRRQRRRHARRTRHSSDRRTNPPALAPGPWSPTPAAQAVAEAAAATVVLHARLRPRGRASCCSSQSLLGDAGPRPCRCGVRGSASAAGVTARAVLWCCVGDRYGLAGCCLAGC